MEGLKVILFLIPESVFRKYFGVPDSISEKRKVYWNSGQYFRKPDSILEFWIVILKVGQYIGISASISENGQYFENPTN
ncbi:Uncharacterised protein [Bacillus freudenreichii]|nr:Uncharacterised protein [Bacillus freudenreichii]